MDELRMYSISDQYISFLRESIPNVYSNKEGERSHTRKYIGVVFTVEGFNYFIPLSSPKPSDYEVRDGFSVIRRSVIPIFRITEKNSRGEMELKGTLRLSNMIPVPLSELEIYDVDLEADCSYKDLVQKEIIFIRKNKEKIRNNAQLLYKQKKENDTSAKYVATTLDFRLLETKYNEFIAKIVLE